MKLPTNQLYFTEVGPPPETPGSDPAGDTISVRKEIHFSRGLLLDGGISTAEIAAYTAAAFRNELEDLLAKYREELKV